MSQLDLAPQTFFPFYAQILASLKCNVKKKNLEKVMGGFHVLKSVKMGDKDPTSHS
jgi:hypothetical protein